MSDFIGWLTQVMDITFSLGSVTLSLGSLVIGFIVIRFGISFVKSLLGRR